MKILDFTKLGLYGIFLNYYCYYVIQGSFIPYGTMLFFIIALVGALIDFWNHGTVVVRLAPVKSFILYGILAFITSVAIINSGISGLISDIVLYFRRLLIVMMVSHVCIREKSVGFAIRLLAVTAVACAIAILMNLGDYQLKLDITTDANLSANDIGSIMAYGVFAVMFAFNKKNGNGPISLFIKMLAVIACVMVIFVAGSRKSIIAVILFIALLLLFCARDYSKYSSVTQVLVFIIIGIIGFYIIQKYLWPYASGTNLYDRLFGDNAAGAASSDTVRLELYRQAFSEFAANPVAGVGYNKFVKLYGNYTHSTYAEPLACSGLIGLFYLYPYVYILKNQFKFSFRVHMEAKERTFQKVLMAFLIAFLFVGVGIPYIYKDVPCIVLGIYISSQYLTYRRFNKNGY